ncbi:hypothetical protein AB6A40_006625 [Gnathostoma spinigerum]|uniref:Integrase zinc-binding domain-containing protein n=1 Tax=Gnathostoma spinigerum TaxID=75299 RepID=A0ABD6ER48_9BILA
MELWPEWTLTQSLVTVTAGVKQPELTELIDCRRFSDLSKLTKTIIHILRVLKRMMHNTTIHLVQNMWRDVESKGPIQRMEVETATNLLVTQEQRRAREEMEVNRENLNTFKYERGLIRCQGRLQTANLTTDQKSPILLPKSSPFTKLIILDSHQRLGHMGTTATLAEVRQRFWIPKGRSVVKYVLGRYCMPCRRWNARPFQLPTFPPLPSSKTQEARPFQHSGLDNFGPINVKDEKGQKKMWIALFTCLATRAVYLEVANSLSAEQFLHILRRFIAKNGIADSIISDNASNFALVQLVLNQSLTMKIVEIHNPLLPMAGWSLRKDRGNYKNCTQESSWQKAAVNGRITNPCRRV